MKKILNFIKNDYFTIFLRIFLIIAMAIWLYEENWIIIFISVLMLCITYFYVFYSKYKIKIPKEFQIIIIFFICTSLFLWEVQNFYIKFPWWDIIHHLVSWIALWFIWFLILYVFYKTWKFNVPPLVVVIFSFSFWIALWTIWEIIEFSLDQFLWFNMQKSYISWDEFVNDFYTTRYWVLDTMYDLIIDTIGSLIASFTGYRYLIKGMEFKVFHYLIWKIEENNKKLFDKIN